MPVNKDFEDFILDQLDGIDQIETKRMFGGLALLYQGSAFAKIKHGKVWLKVDDHNKTEFEKLGMKQYTYGKNNDCKLNFFETPVEVMEDNVQLKTWAKRSLQAAIQKK